MIVTEFRNPKELKLDVAYLPIYGTLEQCITQVQKQYPWLESGSAYYHPLTKTLFIPADYVGEKKA